MPCNPVTRLFRWLIIISLVFTCTGRVKGQGKISVTAGAGFYELFNAGIQWNYGEISSLSVYGGYNFGINDVTQWSAGIAFDQTYRKPVLWKIRAGYSLGALLWTSDDERYYFSNVAFPFMALLAFPVSGAITIRAEGGMIINVPVVSERKQNVEAGYPERFNGNAKVSVIYKFGAK